MAILFYKQSINVTESIRKDIRKLSKEEQKSYLGTVEGTYRRLADLLLQQDRILEAQQVLDLLKVEELNQYLRNVRGNEETAKGTDLLPSERNIIALGNELAELQKLDKPTPKQQERLAYLTNRETESNKQFNAFLQSPAVQKQLDELRRVEKAQNVDLEKYNRLRANLNKLQNAALFYPLILEDRLELILITATTPPIRKTIKLKRTELNDAIFSFRNDLRDPVSPDTKETAQKFHNWLVKPFEAELQQANIQTIIYAPDGQLRYIPLAALYDGKQWLVERYRINNITASSLTDFTPRTSAKLHILAAAVTKSQTVQIDKERSIPFAALPATKVEVENIAAQISNTTKLIDRDFTKTTLEPKLNTHTIIHLATHGYLDIYKPDDSFILLGDGDRATLKDMGNWTLTNVNLVILSACQTAIGGKIGSGIEILGLGYRLHDVGASAAIASLWKVDDAGTQKLMKAFYDQLKQGNIPPAEALRKAQLSLIKSDLNHPFYWSAFILIGNGF